MQRRNVVSVSATTPGRASAPSPAQNMSMGLLSGVSPIPAATPATPRLGGAAGPSGSTAARRSALSEPNDQQRFDVGGSTLRGAAAAPTAADVTFPFNIDLASRLLNRQQQQQQQHGRATPPPAAASAGAGAPVNIGKDELVGLQVQIADYVDNLDRTLRTLFAGDNAKVRRRMRENAQLPATFAYFRCQQAMLRLTDDLTVAREREMLAKLAALLDG